jgi:hypothetical protein
VGGIKQGKFKRDSLSRLRATARHQTVLPPPGITLVCESPVQPPSELERLNWPASGYVRDTDYCNAQRSANKAQQVTDCCRDYHGQRLRSTEIRLDACIAIIPNDISTLRTLSFALPKATLSLPIPLAVPSRS